MNQTFKKKLLVAGIASAFAIVAGGVSTAALANTFADTTISNTDSTGAKVPASATAAVTGISVAFTEALTGSVAASTSSSQVLRLQLSNSAKFVSGTVTFSGGFAAAPTANADAAVASAVGAGYRTVTIGGTAVTGGTITVNYMKADGTVGSTTYTNVTDIATSGAALKTALVNAGFATADVTDSGAGVVTIAAGKGSFLSLSGTATGTSPTIGVSNLGAYGVDANGVVSIPVVTKSSSTAGVITLSSMTIDTSKSAVGTAVALSVAQAPTGLTASNTTTIAQVTASGVTAGLVTASTEIQTVDGVVTNALPSFKLSEAFPADIKVTASNLAPIKVVLDSGLKLTTDAVVTFSGGFAAAPAANANAATASAVGAGYRTVTIGGTAVTGGTITVNYMKADGTVGSTTYTNVTDIATSGAALKTALVNAGFATADVTDSGAGVVTIAVGKGSFLSLSGTATGTSPTIGVSNLGAYGIDANGVLWLPVVTASSSTAGVITISSAKANVPVGTAAGDIKATFTATVGSAAATTSVKVASVVSKGTSLVIKDTNTPVVGVNKVFAGRLTQDPFPAGVTLRYTETAPATVVNNSLVTFTLNNGKFTNTAAFTDTQAGSGTDFNNTFTLDSTGKILTASVGTQSTSATSSDYNTLDITSINLSSVTAAGDLNLSIGGNSAVTAQTVKIADIITATTTSASGTVQTAVPGGVITLPDVIVTENKTGALGASAVIAIDIPNATIQTAAGNDAADNGALTVSGTTKDFTLTVTDANGNAITPASVTAQNGAAGSVRQVLVTLPSSASNTTSGVYTVKFSGLKVKVSSSATAGDITATVASAQGGAGSFITGAEDTSTWDSTAGAFKATVKVGSVVSNTNPSYPTATVTDSTKAVIAGLPLVAAGNDQGKPGAVYVAVVFQGNVFFLSSTGTWSQFTSAATVPAYFTGTLGTTTLDIVKTALDLTPIKGAQIVAGYGLGIAGLSSPFDDFIKNSRYNVVYTVQ